MQQASTVAIFCEDIRAEKSGQDTIVGTLPDNLIARAQNHQQEVAPNTKALLPRLGLYLRIHLDAQQDIPKEISAKLLNTDGNPLILTTWEHSVVEKAFADSREKSLPLVGLIFKGVLSPLPVAIEGGKLVAVVIVDGVEQIAGTLNVIVPVPSVSQPP